LGRSGVELARYVLAQQLALAAEPYDALHQKWAGGPGSLATSNSVLADITLQDVPLGNGRISVKITDLERKFNINLADEAVLQHAFILMGVDAGEFPVAVSSILDWMDPDDLEHMNGAESDYYQSLQPPYYAKNRPIDDLSELLLVKGVTPEMYWGPACTNRSPGRLQRQLNPLGRAGQPPFYTVGLVDLFTPLSSGKINVNTAPATALQMIPGVDEIIATEIIRMRSGPDGVDGTEDDTPLRNPGELVNVLRNYQATAQISRFCAVRSATFEVHVDAEVGGYHRQFVAILGRNSPRDVQVLSFYWK